MVNEGEVEIDTQSLRVADLWISCHVHNHNQHVIIRSIFFVIFINSSFDR